MDLFMFIFSASYLEGGLMRNAVMIQQTNTADMLEEAVEYVKFLQRQIQVLIVTSMLLFA